MTTSGIYSSNREANTSPSNPENAINEGLALQKKGHLDAAKSKYISLLKQQPDNADAWHLLGMALFSSGQLGESINCLDQALKFAPNHADVLSNLGLVYRASGDLLTARKTLELAASRKPESIEIKNNLGTVCLEQRDFAAAETQFQRALALNPKFDNAAMNLGNLWRLQGRMIDAELIYRQAMIHSPDHPQLVTNLADTLRSLGKFLEALELLKNVLSRYTNLREARICRSRCLSKTGRFVEALNDLNDWIENHPEDAQALHYLGQVYFDSGQLELAKENIMASIRLDPNDFFSWNSLGRTNVERGCLPEAEACFRRSLEIDPAQSDSHSFLLFIVSSDPKIDQQQLFEEHKNWARIHCQPKTCTHKNSTERDRRLRIGYVSPDFKNHAVASFIGPVLKSHDQDRFEIFGFGEVENEDEKTDEIRQSVNHYFCTIGWSHKQLAEKIVAHEIDILIDLAGHTAGNRLMSFAMRPAPVQVTWIGYPNTTGMDAMDYRVTCSTQNPLDEPTYHTEELIRMPHGSFCFAEPIDSPDVNHLPLSTNGFVTFGSLHRPSKISELVLDYWSDVLRLDANSKIIVFNTRFTNESSEKLMEGMIHRNVAAHRIEIRDGSNVSNYLDTYHEVDIALDVTPWAGGTTTLEALWMGVPVVAFYGDRRSARSTAAIVNAVGYPDWIARSPSEYSNVVNRLMKNQGKLAEYRAELRQKVKSTICDAQRFTNELEKEYRWIWHQWCDRTNS